MCVSDHFGALLATYTVVFCMIYSSLILADITILKCLYINNWSKMAMAEDNFWSRILIVLNLIISGSCVFIRLYLGEASTNFHYVRLSNSHLMENSLQSNILHRRINTWYCTYTLLLNFIIYQSKSSSLIGSHFSQLEFPLAYLYVAQFLFGASN